MEYKTRLDANENVASSPYGLFASTDQRPQSGKEEAESLNEGTALDYGGRGDSGWVSMQGCEVCDESAFSSQATMTMHIESLHHCTSLLRLYFIYQNPPIPLNEIPYSQKLEVPPELHSELYPKEDEPSFKRLMLGRSGIVLGYSCTVCDVTLEGMTSWLDHVYSVSHTQAVERSVKALGLRGHWDRFPNVPVPKQLRVDHEMTSADMENKKHTSQGALRGVPNLTISVNTKRVTSRSASPSCEMADDERRVVLNSPTETSSYYDERKDMATTRKSLKRSHIGSQRGSEPADKMTKWTDERELYYGSNVSNNNNDFDVLELNLRQQRESVESDLLELNMTSKEKSRYCKDRNSSEPKASRLYRQNTADADSKQQSRNHTVYDNIASNEDSHEPAHSTDIKSNPQAVPSVAEFDYKAMLSNVESLEDQMNSLLDEVWGNNTLDESHDTSRNGEGATSEGGSESVASNASQDVCGVSQKRNEAAASTVKDCSSASISQNSAITCDDIVSHSIATHEEPRSIPHATAPKAFTSSHDVASSISSGSSSTKADPERYSSLRESEKPNTTSHYKDGVTPKPCGMMTPEVICPSSPVSSSGSEVGTDASDYASSDEADSIESEGLSKQGVAVSHNHTDGIKQGSISPLRRRIKSAIVIDYDHKSPSISPDRNIVNRSQTQPGIELQQATCVSHTMNKTTVVTPTHGTMSPSSFRQVHCHSSPDSVKSLGSKMDSSRDDDIKPMTVIPLSPSINKSFEAVTNASNRNSDSSRRNVHVLYKPDVLVESDIICSKNEVKGIPGNDRVTASEIVKTPTESAQASTGYTRTTKETTRTSVKISQKEGHRESNGGVKTTSNQKTRVKAANIETNTKDSRQASPAKAKRLSPCSHKHTDSSVKQKSHHRHKGAGRPKTQKCQTASEGISARPSVSVQRKVPYKIIPLTPIRGPDGKVMVSDPRPQKNKPSDTSGSGPDVRESPPETPTPERSDCDGILEPVKIIPLSPLQVAKNSNAASWNIQKHDAKCLSESRNSQEISLSSRNKADERFRNSAATNSSEIMSPTLSGLSLPPNIVRHASLGNSYAEPVSDLHPPARSTNQMMRDHQGAVHVASQTWNGLQKISSPNITSTTEFPQETVTERDGHHPVDSETQPLFSSYTQVEGSQYSNVQRDLSSGLNSQTVPFALSSLPNKNNIMQLLDSIDVKKALEIVRMVDRNRTNNAESIDMSQLNDVMRSTNDTNHGNMRNGASSKSFSGANSSTCEVPSRTAIYQNQSEAGVDTSKLHPQHELSQGNVGQFSDQLTNTKKPSPERSQVMLQFEKNWYEITRKQSSDTNSQDESQPENVISIPNDLENSQGHTEVQEQSHIQDQVQCRLPVEDMNVYYHKGVSLNEETVDKIQNDYPTIQMNSKYTPVIFEYSHTTNVQNYSPQRRAEIDESTQNTLARNNHSHAYQNVPQIDTDLKDVNNTKSVPFERYSSRGTPLEMETQIKQDEMPAASATKSRDDPDDIYSVPHIKTARHVGTHDREPYSPISESSIPPSSPSIAKSVPIISASEILKFHNRNGDEQNTNKPSEYGSDSAHEFDNDLEKEQQQCANETNMKQMNSGLVAINGNNNKSLSVDSNRASPWEVFDNEISDLIERNERMQNEVSNQRDDRATVNPCDENSNITSENSCDIAMRHNKAPDLGASRKISPNRDLMFGKWADASENEETNSDEERGADDSFVDGLLDDTLTEEHMEGVVETPNRPFPSFEKSPILADNPLVLFMPRKDGVVGLMEGGESTESQKDDGHGDKVSDVENGTLTPTLTSQETRGVFVEDHEIHKPVDAVETSKMHAFVEEQLNEFLNLTSPKHKTPKSHNRKHDSPVVETFTADPAQDDYRNEELIKQKLEKRIAKRLRAMEKGDHKGSSAESEADTKREQKSSKSRKRKRKKSRKEKTICKENHKCDRDRVKERERDSKDASRERMGERNRERRSRSSSLEGRHSRESSDQRRFKNISENVGKEKCHTRHRKDSVNDSRSTMKNFVWSTRQANSANLDKSVCRSRSKKRSPKGHKKSKKRSRSISPSDKHVKSKRKSSSKTASPEKHKSKSSSNSKRKRKKKKAKAKAKAMPMYASSTESGELSTTTEEESSEGEEEENECTRKELYMKLLKQRAEKETQGPRNDSTNELGNNFKISYDDGEGEISVLPTKPIQTPKTSTVSGDNFSTEAESMRKQTNASNAVPSETVHVMTVARSEINHCINSAVEDTIDDKIELMLRERVQKSLSYFTQVQDSKNSPDSAHQPIAGENMKSACAKEKRTDNKPEVVQIGNNETSQIEPMNATKTNLWKKPKFKMLLRGAQSKLTNAFSPKSKRIPSKRRKSVESSSSGEEEADYIESLFQCEIKRKKCGGPIEISGSGVPVDNTDTESGSDISVNE